MTDATRGAGETAERARILPLITRLATTLVVFGFFAAGSAAVASAADVPIDALGGSPGAAWTATGLLSVVLGLILGKHLPELMRQLAAKDTQLLAAIDAKDKQHASAVETVVDQFTTAVERQRTEFRETLEIIQSHHAREVAGLGEATNKSMDGIATAVRALESAIALLTKRGATP